MTFFEILKDYSEDDLVARRTSWPDMWIWCRGFYDHVWVCVPSESGGDYCFPWNPSPDELLADDWEAF